jgi:hypothetical protein
MHTYIHSVHCVIIDARTLACLSSFLQHKYIEFQMGVAAVVHLKVFPAKPYRRGERNVPNVAVMSDYASLGAPDPEEIGGIDSLTILQTPVTKDRQLSFSQSVRDVVLGSGEIVCFSHSSCFILTYSIHPNY